MPDACLVDTRIMVYHSGKEAESVFGFGHDTGIEEGEG